MSKNSFNLFYHQKSFDGKTGYQQKRAITFEQ
jgi:hypothetical protein